MKFFNSLGTKRELECKTDRDLKLLIIPKPKYSYTVTHSKALLFEFTPKTLKGYIHCVCSRPHFTFLSN